MGLNFFFLFPFSFWQVDIIRTVLLPQLARFGIEQGVQLKVNFTFAKWDKREKNQIAEIFFLNGLDHETRRAPSWWRRGGVQLQQCAPAQACQLCR